jgi:protein gp37
MRDLLNGELGWAAKLEHVWWGVSVEDRKYGVPRIEQLRAIASAKVRFLVLEPLLEDLGPLNLEGIDWVIVGGESGPGARPLQEAWVRSVMEQCRRDGVRFFFKQWGGTRRDKGAPTLDGRTFTESPELRADPIPAEAERRRRLQAAEALAAAWKSRAGTSKLILLPNA